MPSPRSPQEILDALGMTADEVLGPLPPKDAVELAPEDYRDPEVLPVGEEPPAEGARTPRGRIAKGYASAVYEDGNTALRSLRGDMADHLITQGLTPEDARLAAYEDTRHLEATGHVEDSEDAADAIRAREGEPTVGKALTLAVNRVTPIGLDQGPEEWGRRVRENEKATWGERSDALGKALQGEEITEADAKAAGIDIPLVQELKKTYVSHLGELAYTVGSAGILPTVGSITGLIPGWGDVVEQSGKNLEVAKEGKKHVTSEELVKLAAYGGVNSPIGDAIPYIVDAAVDFHDAVTGEDKQGRLRSATGGSVGDVLRDFVSKGRHNDKFDPAAKALYEEGDLTSLGQLGMVDIPEHVPAVKVDLQTLKSATEGGGLLYGTPEADRFRVGVANGLSDDVLQTLADEIPLEVVRRVQPDAGPTLRSVLAAYTARKKIQEIVGTPEADDALKVAAAALHDREVREDGSVYFVPSTMQKALTAINAAVPLVIEADVPVLGPVAGVYGGVLKAMGFEKLGGMVESARFPTAAGNESMVASGDFDWVLEGMGLQGSTSSERRRDIGESRYIDRVLADMQLPQYQNWGLKELGRDLGVKPGSTADVALGTADLGADIVVPFEEMFLGPAGSAVTMASRAATAAKLSKMLGRSNSQAARIAVRTALPQFLGGSTDAVAAMDAALRTAVADSVAAGEVLFTVGRGEDAVKGTLSKEVQRAVGNLLEDAGIRKEEVFRTVNDLSFAQKAKNTVIVKDWMARGTPEQKALRETAEWKAVRQGLEESAPPEVVDAGMALNEWMAHQAVVLGEFRSPKDWFAAQRVGKAADGAAPPPPRPTTVTDALRAAATDADGEVSAMAARLLAMNHPAVTSSALDVGVDLGHGVHGRYDIADNRITLSPSATASTLVHEVAHAVTAHAIRNVDTLSPAGRQAVADLQALYAKASESPDLQAVGLGLDNLDEFIAEAYSNPAFREALRKVKVTPTKSAWRVFVDTVGHLLGLKTKPELDALDRTLSKIEVVAKERVVPGRGGGSLASRAALVKDPPPPKQPQVVPDRRPEDVWADTRGPLGWWMDLEDAEVALHNLAEEHVVMFAGDGRQLARFGPEDTRLIEPPVDPVKCCVVYPRALDDMALDGLATYTHNHPSGGPPSTDDFLIAIRGDAAALRAVSAGNGFTWVVRRPARGWPNAKHLRQSVDIANAAAQRTASREMDRLVIEAGGDPLSGASMTGYSDAQWKKIFGEHYAKTLEKALEIFDISLEREAHRGDVGLGAGVREGAAEPSGTGPSPAYPPTKVGEQGRLFSRAAEYHGVDGKPRVLNNEFDFDPEDARQARAAFERLGRPPTLAEIITRRNVDEVLEHLREQNPELGPERADHVRRKVAPALAELGALEDEVARAFDDLWKGGTPSEAQWQVLATTRARAKAAHDALRVLLENESRKAKATPPFVSTRTGTDAVRARLSAAERFEGVRAEDARDAQRMLEMLGHPLEGGAFKLKKTLNRADTVVGTYNFTDDVLSLAQRAFDSGMSARVLAHEIGHRVSAWLPKDKAATLLRQYVKERRVAMKANPEWFDANGKMIADDNAAYRWSSVDEWFAERFADHAHKRLGQWDASTRSVMDAARFLLEKVKARIVEFFGVDAVPGVVEDLMAGKVDRVVADARAPLRDRLIEVTDVSGHGNAARPGPLYSRAATAGAAPAPLAVPKPSLPEPTDEVRRAHQALVVKRLLSPSAETRAAHQAYQAEHPEVLAWAEYRAAVADAELAQAREAARAEYEAGAPARQAAADAKAARYADAKATGKKLPPEERATNRREWFGDSAVTTTGEAGGKPLVVTHESPSKFSEFRAGEFGFHFGVGIPDGMFGSNRVSGLLRINNPMRMADLGVWTPERVLAEGGFSTAEQPRLLAEVERIRAEADAPTKAMVAKARASGDVATAEKWQALLEDGSDAATFRDRRGNYLASRPVHDALREKGYDGIVYRNEAEGVDDSYIAFEPQQFKSNKNVGTYDATDPRFLYSRSAPARAAKYRGVDGKPRTATMFSGGGLVEAGLRKYIDPVFAVEANPEIGAAYKAAHGGHVRIDDVRNVDLGEAGDVDYLHASPVCKNFSAAKAITESGEQPLDLETARATADAIRRAQPAVFTLENVRGYQGTEAMTIVEDALREGGYTFDANVYDAADYGAATRRKRLLLRAVKDGKLPPAPAPTHGPGRAQPYADWYAAVEDLVDGLPDDKVPPWMRRRLEAAGVNPDAPSKPTLVMGGSAGKNVPYAEAGGPAPTFKATPGEAHRIIFPDGRVKRVTPRAAARITGLPDDYPLPTKTATATTIIGNGVPPALSEAVFAPLLAGERVPGSAPSRLYSRAPGNQTDTPAFRAFIAGTKVVDETGAPRRLYHGTTHEFDAFDARRGNAQNHHGRGIYLTSEPEDVGANYATRQGPDLQGRIESLHEELVNVWDDAEAAADMVRDWADAHPERAADAAQLLKALASPFEHSFVVRAAADLHSDGPDVVLLRDITRWVAEKQIAGTHDGAVLPVYAAIKNPVDLRPGKVTRFDIETKWSEDGEDFLGEEGLGVQAKEAIQEVAGYYDDRNLADEVLSALDDPEGFTAADLEQAVRRIGSDWTDTNGEASSPGQFLQDVYREMGFDGIVIDAGRVFGAGRQYGKAMAGVVPSTEHWVAFEPTQVKSATGNVGTFDPKDPRFLFSLAPDGSGPTWTAEAPPPGAKVPGIVDNPAYKIWARETAILANAVDRAVSREAKEAGMWWARHGDPALPAPKTWEAVQSWWAAAGSDPRTTPAPSASLRSDWRYIDLQREAIREEPPRTVAGTANPAYAEWNNERVRLARESFALEDAELTAWWEHYGPASGARRPSSFAEAQAYWTERGDDPAGFPEPSPELLGLLRARDKHAATQVPQVIPGTMDDPARVIVRYFKTANMQALLEQNAQVIRMLLGETWAGDLMRFFDHEVDAASGQVRLTKKGEERFNVALARVLRGDLAPRGRVRAYFEELRDALSDIWLNLRGKPMSLPPGFRQWWDATLDPAKHLRARVRVSDERLGRQPLEVNVTVKENDPDAPPPPDPTRLGRELADVTDVIYREDFKRANALHEYWNLPLTPGQKRHALGILGSDTDVDAVEAVAKAIALLGTTQARRRWGFSGKVVRVGRRSQVSEDRKESVLKRAREALHGAIGGDVVAAPDGGVTLTPEQAKGLAAHLDHLVDAGWGEQLPDELISPQKDLTKLTEQEWSDIANTTVDDVAGPGSYRDRQADRVVGNAAESLLGRAVDALSTVPIFNGVRRKLTEAFDTTFAGSKNINPAVAEVVDGWRREFSDVASQIARLREHVRAGTADETAEVLIRKIAKELPAVGPDPKVVDDLVVLNRALNPGPDEAAPTVQTFLNNKAALRALFDATPAHGPAGIVEADALPRLLRLAATSDIKDPVIAAAIEVIQTGIRRRYEAVRDTGLRIEQRMSGRADLGVATGDPNLPINAYKLWYERKYQEIAAQAQRRGQTTDPGKSGASGSSSDAAGLVFDPVSGALAVVTGLLADGVLASAAADMMRLGLPVHTDSVNFGGRNFDQWVPLGSTSMSRAKYRALVQEYMNAILSFQGSQSKQFNEAREFVGTEMLPVQVSGLNDGKFDPSAWADAHRILDSWGIKSNTSGMETMVLPTGEEVFMPKIIKDELTGLFDRTAKAGLPWTKSAEGEPDKILGRFGEFVDGRLYPNNNLQYKGKGSLADNVNIAVRTMVNIPGRTLAMARVGVTTGVGIPNPAFYIGNVFGGLLQAVQSKGAVGTARMLGRYLPGVGGDAGKVLRSVFCRVWGDSQGYFKPASGSFIADNGAVISDDFITKTVVKYGLHTSQPRAESAIRIIDDLRNHEGTFWTRVKRDRIFDVPLLGTAESAVRTGVSTTFRYWQGILGDAATAVDDLFRVATYVDELAGGVAPAEAAAVARRTSFDYADLTDFEKEHLRRLIMFYTFQRRNADLFWWTMLNHPSRIMGQVRAVRDAQEHFLGEDDSESILPEHLDGRLIIGMRKTLGDEAALRGSLGTMTVAPPLPAMDHLGLWVSIFRSLNSDEPRGGREIISRLAPEYQAPFVLGLEVDIFSGRDLAAFNTVPSWMVEMDRQISGGAMVDDLFKVRKTENSDPSRDEAPGVDRWEPTGEGAKWWWVFRNLVQVPPFGRGTDTITQMARADWIVGDVVNGARWYRATQGPVGAIRDNLTDPFFRSVVRPMMDALPHVDPSAVQVYEPPAISEDLNVERAGYTPGLEAAQLFGVKSVIVPTRAIADDADEVDRRRRISTSASEERKRDPYR